MENGGLTHRRKSEHIDICLNEPVQSRLSSGFDQYRFIHQALPEIDLSEVRLSAHFLGKPVNTPFLVSSMTGGTEEAAAINRNLAIAAQQRGWSLGIGSMRAALEDEHSAPTFEVRKYAPTIPILANLGLVQLNYGYGLEQCKRAVELIGADALLFHLNSMQEVFQPEGDTNFSGLLQKLERICSAIGVPVGVKEVGWGIDGPTAARLYNAGVAFVDVAGAGGTSWSEVERKRGTDAVRAAAAEAFADWGIPTAVCVHSVRSCCPDGVIVASGGISNGVAAAKAVVLGADMIGFGRSLLGAATHSTEQVEALFERIEAEFTFAMFGVGVSTIAQLKDARHLLVKHQSA